MAFTSAESEKPFFLNPASSPSAVITRLQRRAYGEGIDFLSLATGVWLPSYKPLYVPWATWSSHLNMSLQSSPFLNSLADLITLTPPSAEASSLHFWKRALLGSSLPFELPHPVPSCPSKAGRLRVMWLFLLFELTPLGRRCIFPLVLPAALYSVCQIQEEFFIFPPPLPLSASTTFVPFYHPMSSNPAESQEFSQDCL